VITIGLDPGLTGALAILNESGDCERVADLPVIRDGKLSWIDGSALQSLLIDSLAGRPARAFVERVQAFPQQGRSSAFNFGVGFGSILSILQARHIAIELVMPTQWKKALGLSNDKRASLDKARLLFPTAELHLAKHDGRAEALLLARYGMGRATSGARVAA
jgi:crossover junction endodeoxyribonuclease RuvC